MTDKTKDFTEKWLDKKYTSSNPQDIKDYDQVVKISGYTGYEIKRDANGKHKLSKR